MAVKGHRVFMPPKMPKVPKGPVLPNFRSKAKPKTPAQARKCKGGPWDGQTVKMSIPSGETSLIIRVGDFYGRYRKSTIALTWEDIK